MVDNILGHGLDIPLLGDYIFKQEYTVHTLQILTW